MDRREPPATEEGWYVLHDLRRVDWDAWRAAPERERRRAIDEGVAYLRAHEDLEDVDGEAGGSAVFSVLGHKADILVLHLRPATADLDRAERAFERTALAGFTERAASYVSVTEVSGYTTDALEEGGVEAVEETGLRRYLQSRLYPEIPDAAHVCFYPMDKRRGPEDNWYDLPFEERAEHLSRHGEIGRAYADRVTQIITGSVGLDDFEWGVTLFADDLTDVKHLLYEMRFDPSTSRFAEFGQFYVGRRFPPEDLGALLAGEPVPTEGADEATVHPPSHAGGVGGDAGHPGGEPAGSPDATEPGGRPATAEHGHGHGHGHGTGPNAGAEVEGGTRVTSGRGTGDSDGGHGHGHGDSEADDRPRGDASGGHVSGGDHSDGDASDDGHPETGGGRPQVEEAPHEELDGEQLAQQLRKLGIDLGDHPEAGYGLVFRSDADAEALVEEVEGLRGNFDHYDTHVLTAVRADAGQSAVVSLWANQRAADTASGFLADLSGTGPGVGGPLGASGGGTDDAPGRQDDGRADDASADGAGDDASGADGAGGDDGAGAGGSADTADAADAADAAALREELADLGVYAGQPHGEDVHAMVLYSEAAPDALAAGVEDLRAGFADEAAHVRTAVYESRTTDRAAVVSLWERADAADRAGRALADLPGVVGRAGDAEGGFDTLGMFYTVVPDHRGDFLDRFETVGDLLAGMDGHEETDLLVNREDENDMFIASRWASRDDAMAFFRSEAFRDTVQWGREVLADRPRHVFLA